MCVCTSAKHKRALTIHHPSRVNLVHSSSPIVSLTADPIPPRRRSEGSIRIPFQRRREVRLPISPAATDPPSLGFQGALACIPALQAHSDPQPSLRHERRAGLGVILDGIPIVKSPRRRANGTDGGGKIQSRVVPYVCTSTLSHPTSSNANFGWEKSRGQGRLLT